MNLLEETLEKLKEHGKTPEDITWIGCLSDGYFTWDEFKKLADVEYDDGYGTAEVDEGLVIVGDTWWLSRGEYDGSEWWDFNEKPEKPTNEIDPQALVRNQMGRRGSDSYYRDFSFWRANKEKP